MVQAAIATKKIIIKISKSKSTHLRGEKREGGEGGGEHQLTTEQKIRAIPSDSNPIYQPAACRGILTVDVEVVDGWGNGGCNCSLSYQRR